MTSIDCTGTHHYCKLTVDRVGEGDAYLKIMGKEPHIRVPIAELLEALDATANADVKHRADVYAKLNEAEANLREVRQDRRDLAEQSHQNARRAIEAETKLAEAEATIERVREIAENSYNSSWLALKGIRDALDPKPAFELPTEVPARIIAVTRSTGDEKELTLFTDGDTTWWADIDDWGPFWTRSQVMEQFTDHRLLGSEE